MATIYLPVGSLLYFNTTLKISEHNRQPVSFGYNRIESTKRMSNGTLRKFFVADKRTISASWNMIPSYSTYTVDGGYGALDLKAFYNGTSAKSSGALSGQATFDVTVKFGTTNTTMEMIFTSFSCELVKRNVKESTTDTPQEFWNVSLSLDEV